MSPRSHPRPVPPAHSGVEIRLPWWAIALPAIAFAALLLLLTGSADAHAATGSGAVSQVLGLVRQVITHEGA
ncbi:hypothetical protein HUT19_31395 [Streptomyces sp. NA02950]|uniref:hypothetical protein n=1 Tax=Streptomyces sp. NA02950 TaxID=2742137 RepID=UPI0015905C59|nr:hypothetical protein [Streptomyces sp. NA02950]QKV95696.1 hypothetical protein HUT19_31395 [Streptomyces sp. NA02950]